MKSLGPERVSLYGEDPARDAIRVLPYWEFFKPELPVASSLIVTRSRKCLPPLIGTIFLRFRGGDYHFSPSTKNLPPKPVSLHCYSFLCRILCESFPICGGCIAFATGAGPSMRKSFIFLHGDR